MNRNPPWRSHHELSDPIALDIVQSQFPEIQAGEITWRGEGWDFEAVEIDRQWIFRFPKRKSEEARLDCETLVLPQIASSLPVPIPAYEFLGQPDERFPCRFAGYRKLSGISAMEHASPQPTELAPQLGEFLTALHSISCAAMAAKGVSPVDPSEPIEHRWVNARQLFARLCELPDRVIPVELAEACADYFRRAPTAGPPGARQPRFLHSDLRPEHILLSERGNRLGGIIDWTDMEIGDPAMDFAALHAWQGPGFLQQVIEHYRLPVDEHFEDRTILIGTSGCLDDIWYGVETKRQEYVRQGLAGLRQLLGDGGH